VKNSILLSSSEAGSFYGKTGTGRVDGHDVNGWFVGLIKAADNTYFFATNISASEGAAGSDAA
jgi:bla regulator protein BlaR1